MKRALAALVVILAVYGAIAYLLLPSLWRHYEHQKKLDGLPMVTVTAQGIPAYPVNVGLVGLRNDILCAMREAGWVPADPHPFGIPLRCGQAKLAQAGREIDAGVVPVRP